MFRNTSVFSKGVKTHENEKHQIQGSYLCKVERGPSLYNTLFNNYVYLFFLCMPEIFRILKRNFKEKEQLAPVGTILYLLFIKTNKMDDIHVDNRLSWVFPHFETNFVVEEKK